MTETSFTVSIAGAIAVYLVPVLALPEPVAAPDDDIFVCGHPAPCCDELAPDEPELAPDAASMSLDEDRHREPWLSRQQAIEMARGGSVFGRLPILEPTAIREPTVDDDIYLEILEDTCGHTRAHRWRVRQAPLLPATRGLVVPTRVELARPIVAGPIESPTVARVLARHRRELAACAPPDHELQYPVQFLIRDDGTVAPVRTDVPVRACLERVVERVRFPARYQPTQVLVPITLRSESLAYGVRP